MSIIINLVGCSSSPLICFVFPALFYMKSIKEISTTKRIFLYIFFVYLMIMIGIWGIIDFYFQFS